MSGSRIGCADENKANKPKAVATTAILSVNAISPLQIGLGKHDLPKIRFILGVTQLDVGAAAKPPARAV